MVSAADKRKAAQRNEEGLLHYRHWQMEEAIAAFQQAAELDPELADHHLNLARAMVRYGDYEGTLKALGNFLRVESDPGIVERFERLFGSAMDAVESLLIKTMTQYDLTLEMIGASIQMWMEYRIAVGRHQLDVSNAAPWAAAVDVTVRKVNFRELPLKQVAEWYGAAPAAVRKHHLDLVSTLDIMPCDYRYFKQEQNPLDKLVEAASMLEDLEERFHNI
jgi:tetratricopeptide (TPR) repeat protein